MINIVPARDRRDANLSLHGFPVFRRKAIKLSSSVYFSSSMLREVREQWRAERFDLVHLHFPDPMAHLASLLIPSDVPRIISWHSDIVRQKHALRIYRRFLLHSLLEAKAIVVATPAHADGSAFLTDPRLTSKIITIPYGFELERFRKPQKEASDLQARHGSSFVFTLGRHVSYKGFDVLVRAMNEVAPQTRLVVGGVGPLTQNLISLATTMDLRDRIDFVGAISEGMLPAYFQACTLFCLPSISKAEAFGIVQLEAMAAGKAVVSTALHTGVDLVNRHGLTGLVVPPGDEKALARAINQLIRDSQMREQMGAQGRVVSAAEYSLEEMGRRYLELYERIARKTGD
jgi:rhamnosyl/mannosyltransferase